MFLMLLANPALTLNPAPRRRCASRSGTSNPGFLPCSQRSVGEQGTGDEGQTAPKSIDQQHLFLLRMLGWLALLLLAACAANNSAPAPPADLPLTPDRPTFLFFFTDP